MEAKKREITEYKDLYFLNKLGKKANVGIKIPYFGEIIIQDELGTTKVLIGFHKVMNEDNVVVVDWKEDIARLLYEGNIGEEAEYEMEGKKRKCVLLDKKRGDKELNSKQLPIINFIRQGRKVVRVFDNHRYGFYVHRLLPELSSAVYNVTVLDLYMELCEGFNVKAKTKELNPHQFKKSEEFYYIIANYVTYLKKTLLNKIYTIEYSDKFFLDKEKIKGKIKEEDNLSTIINKITSAYDRLIEISFVDKTFIREQKKQVKKIFTDVDPVSLYKKMFLDREFKKEYGHLEQFNKLTTDFANVVGGILEYEDAVPYIFFKSLIMPIPIYRDVTDVILDINCFNRDELVVLNMIFPRATLDTFPTQKKESQTPIFIKKIERKELEKEVKRCYFQFKEQYKLTAVVAKYNIPNIKVLKYQLEKGIGFVHFDEAKRIDEYDAIIAFDLTEKDLNQLRAKSIIVHFEII